MMSSWGWGWNHCVPCCPQATEDDEAGWAGVKPTELPGEAEAAFDLPD